MTKIKLVLPAYNEALSIVSLLQKLKTIQLGSEYTFEVLVVNDGSTDSTKALVESFPLQGLSLLDLQPNRGLAGALREGLSYALKDMSEEDILLTMDADDSHDPAFISTMIPYFKNSYSVVIASRYQKGSTIHGLSFFRKFLSAGAGTLFSLVFSMKGVRDYTCGYRAYKAGLLKEAMHLHGDAFIEQKGFGCMVEILLKLRPLKPKIKEVPFSLRYDLKKSDSKMNVLKTIRQTLQLIVDEL